jgi:SSS family solute:Na+ symporter
LHFIDYVIFGLYLLGVLGVGYYHYRRNRDADDYYVGGRDMTYKHVGLSVVATDVGGGFSIGLGGLGFVMGLAGTWLLFTGLVGAWLSAVFVIPKLKRLEESRTMRSFPDFLRLRYDERVAFVAALISGVGYLGFTGAQVLAGAKLAAATIITEAPFGLSTLDFAILVIAVVTVLYTVIGGLKAVIYTDTIQWIILLSGLTLVAIPVALWGELGGLDSLRANLPASHFDLFAIAPSQLVNWIATIVPIWLIAMTLYQRVFACRDVKEARRAWYLAGLLEWPVMAFMGVFLGMCARVAYPDVEPEMGLPMLVKNALPPVVTGLLVAAYFSAIMSTADSCLVASSGNFVGDLLERHLLKGMSDRGLIRVSQGVTLLVGVAAILIASRFRQVLDAILFAYAFMVSGLCVPTLAAYFWPGRRPAAALSSMVAGGGVTLLMAIGVVPPPPFLANSGLDPICYGLAASAAVFVAVALAPAVSRRSKPAAPERAAAVAAVDAVDAAAPEVSTDVTTQIGGSQIQHGKYNDRIYLMKLDPTDLPELVERLDELCRAKAYSKIFAKVPASNSKPFLAAGYRQEASVPGFFSGEEDGLFLAYYADEARMHDPRAAKVRDVLAAAESKRVETPPAPVPPPDIDFAPARQEDLAELAKVFAAVFPSYPFPIHDPAFLRESMAGDTRYYCARRNGDLIAVSSAEMDPAAANVEMTDFATLPAARGGGVATHLLALMERDTARLGLRTAYTIARSLSFGMNITFAKRGYRYGGTLINNTNISGQVESMNVWYRPLPT